MKIAVFPGSFDPISHAHTDIVRRAMDLFDQIVVAIGVNSNKQGMLTIPERQEILEAVFAGDKERILVQHYEGLTVDFCKKINARYILRGIRSVSDFEFENAVAQNNHVLAPGIETVFLLSSPGLAHISSTIIRDILRNGGDVSTLVPKAVLDRLLHRS